MSNSASISSVKEETPLHFISVKNDIKTSNEVLSKQIEELRQICDKIAPRSSSPAPQKEIEDRPFGLLNDLAEEQRKLQTNIRNLFEIIGFLQSSVGEDVPRKNL